MWHRSNSFRRPAKRKHCAVIAWLRAIGKATDGVLDYFHQLRWEPVSRLKERIGELVQVKLVSGSIG
jgi:hypothetical protein